MKKHKSKNNETGGIPPLTKSLLPTRLEIEADKIFQPNFIRKSFVVKNLPQTIVGKDKDIFMRLMQLPNTTVTMRVGNLSTTEIKGLVDRQINNNYAGLFRRKMTDKIEAEGDINRLQDFYRDAMHSASGGSAVKSVNIYIETYAQNEESLKLQVTEIINTCLSYGITIEECLLRQKDGFLGVSPIGNDTWGRMYANNIPSTTLGRLFPFSQSYIQDPQGMLLGKTIDNGLINLDIWERGSTRTNSNIIIVGQSGQGKSYLVKKIVSQQVMAGTTVFLLDHDGEYGDICTQMGGTNIYASRGNFVINPLEVRYFRGEDETDEDFDSSMPVFDKNKSPFFQHLSWLSDFYKVAIPNLDSMQGEAPLQLNALKIFTQDLYKKFGIDETTDFSKIKSASYPIFSDLYSYIEDVLEHPQKYNFYKIIDQSVIKGLLLSLHSICKGDLSPLFNKHTNVVNSDFININIQELMTGSESNLQAVLFNYVTYIWSKVLSKTNRVLLGIDELYLFMNRFNLTLCKYLNSFSRRARKYEASLLTATQQLRDCLDDAVVHMTAAIFDTPTYKFLFFPGEIDFDLMKIKLGLTKGEVESIGYSNARHCLLKIGPDKYKMQVGTLPFEKQLFGRGGGR